MNLSGLPAWRVAATLVVLVAWAVVAHRGSSGIGNTDFNAMVAVLPLLFAWGVLLWQGSRWWLRWSGLVFALGLVLYFWSPLRSNIALLYYLEHQGTHLALALLFGRTLLGGGDTLITSMDRYIYGDSLSPRKLRYGRQLTLAWSLFFVLNAMVSTGLFLTAPISLWSIHANLLTGPLMALMFLAEWLVRRRVLPPHERPSLAAVVRAYRQRVDKVPRTSVPPRSGA